MGGAGVNLGGWLVLEDWFFSGTSGSYLDWKTTNFAPRNWPQEKTPRAAKGSVLTGQRLSIWIHEHGSDFLMAVVKLNVSKQKVPTGSVLRTVLAKPRFCNVARSRPRSMSSSVVAAF